MRFALLITVLLAQSWAWAGYTGHRPYDVLHYDATIRPDLATKRVSGLVHIRFTSTQPNLSRLVLDANELEIGDGGMLAKSPPVVKKKKVGKIYLF